MTIFGPMESMDKQWEQFAFAVIVLVVAFLLGRIVRFVVGRFFKAAARKLKVDPTRYNFFKNASDFIILLIAIVIILLLVPLMVGMSMAAIAFVFGQLLYKDGEARNEGSELIDLNV